MDESTTIESSAADQTIELVADIVSAYVSNNSVPVGELSGLITTTHAALTGLAKPAVSAEPAHERATPAQIRKSITPDAIISFIDGKGYKTLKRHLSGNGLTIETYRTRYGLPSDYPSTAASYSAARSALAKQLGLGERRKAAPKAAEPAETVAEAPKPAGRKKAADAPAKPARGRKKTPAAE